MGEAMIGLGVFLCLSLLLRVPMAFAMCMVGFAGFAWKVNFHAAAAMVAQTTYETGLSYTFSVIPLFILMGSFVARAGLSDELYNAAYVFLGDKRGGLAMSTIVASAGFGSICGSSVATAATFAKVSYPPMRQFGYKDSLSTASIAAGGTLGILIPPSTIMVLYGIMTETNIGKLFVAGILPGILATCMLCMAVMWITWRDPLAGPPGKRSSIVERVAAIKSVWPVALLFIGVIGGIYGGVFTTVEGAGMGAAGAFAFALARRTLDWKALIFVLIDATRTTSMLFMILIGALILANFINVTSMPADLTGLVSRFNVSPVAVIVAICAVHIVLGMAMEEFAMILLTVPLFFPVVIHLGYDPIWFGIVIVIIVQIGLISPPVGLNLFVVKNMLEGISLAAVFRGAIPFNVALIALLAIVVAFPRMVLWLPMYMK